MNDFVLWDGKNETPYTIRDDEEDCMRIPKGHEAYTWVIKDSISTHQPDEVIVSVQKLMLQLMSDGLEPVVVFGCKPFKKTYEKKIDGQVRGIFSHCFWEVTKSNKNISLRDHITLANNLIKTLTAKNQECEVIAKPSRLALPFLSETGEFSFHFSGHGVTNFVPASNLLRQIPREEYDGCKIAYMTFDMCRT